MQFQEKLMNQTWDNGKKPSFRPDFGPFSPNLGPINFFMTVPLLDISNYCKLSLYAISTKTNETYLRKYKKALASGQFWPIWPEFVLPFFFFKNLGLSVTRYHGQLLLCKISKKPNDRILRKLRDGQTDRWKWFHRMLSD